MSYIEEDLVMDMNLMTTGQCTHVAARRLRRVASMAVDDGCGRADGRGGFQQRDDFGERV